MTEMEVIINVIKRQKDITRSVLAAKRSTLLKRLVIINLLVIFLLGTTASRVAEATKDYKTFASLSARLSEPGGYFDSDNLISNETSYQHVLGKLREMNVQGGVYVGVGPDQSFTYI